MVIPPEELVEQLAAGGEAGGGVGHKEDQNDQRSDAHEHVSVIPIAVGEKIRNGNGVSTALGVHTQTLGNDQPVQISTNGKTDGGPADLGASAQIRQSRKSHKQITAHVRRLCTHGRDDRSQTPSAQIEIPDTAVFLGVDRSDYDHCRHINENGNENTYD